MKRVSAAAYAAALSMAFSGQAWANQSMEPLSEAQLDTVVAGGVPSNSHGTSSSCSTTTCSGLLGISKVGNVSGVANGNKILSGNDVSILNGNNTAVGVGILGTGAIALRK